MPCRACKGLHRERRARRDQRARVRRRRGGAARDEVSGRPRRDRRARGVARASRLPAPVRHHEDAEVARRIADVRSFQLQQARDHPEHEASRCARDRVALGGLGRRRRREFRAGRDGTMGSGVRRPREGEARPGDGVDLLARTDGARARLPGVRRPGRSDLRLQPPDRLARPRASRAVRDDHRLAVAALRRGRGDGGAAAPRAHGRRSVPRPLAGRVRHLLPRRCLGREGGNRRGALASRECVGARGAARRVPMRGRRPVDRDRDVVGRGMDAPRRISLVDARRKLAAPRWPVGSARVRGGCDRGGDLISRS